MKRNMRIPFHQIDQKARKKPFLLNRYEKVLVACNGKILNADLSEQIHTHNFYRQTRRDIIYLSVHLHNEYVCIFVGKSLMANKMIIIECVFQNNNWVPTTKKEGGCGAIVVDNVTQHNPFLDWLISRKDCIVVIRSARIYICPNFKLFAIFYRTR